MSLSDLASREANKLASFLKTFPVSSLAKRLHQSSFNPGNKQRQPVVSSPSVVKHASPLAEPILAPPKKIVIKKSSVKFFSRVKWTGADLHTHTHTKTRGAEETASQAELHGSQDDC